MVSFTARAAALAATLTGVRKKFAHEHSLTRYVERRRSGPARPPISMRRRFRLALDRRHGFEVYTVAPRSGPTAGNVLYLHGGAYVDDILRWHWRFIARMARRLNMTFTVPLYPLAPQHDCAVTSAFVLAVYRDLLADEAPSPLVVMGDSAGGGLTMSLAMQATSAGMPKPAGLVLLSPWLDVTTSDPLQQRIERSDPLLMRAGLQAAGSWYAGAMPPDDPRVSPLYGPISGLPPMLVLCGTRDILLADARRLAQRAAAEGASLEYHEEPKLMHVYPLMPLPEARRAEERVERFVRRTIASRQPAAESRQNAAVA
jgi:acetyl esterase/lipase